MHLEFFGAAGEVTGSCHILTVGARRVLLDCGMIQGGRDADERNRLPFPFPAGEVDAVVLSHAHIDHSGRLPLLVQRGFTGQIHAQNATVDIAEILLRDSAYVSASQVRRSNRWRQRRGEELLEPLYEQEDVERTQALFEGHRYREWFDVTDGVRARFHDAGHILGSAIVEVEVSERGVTRRVVFSGDLGQFDSPILHDPAGLAESLAGADVVLMESTYGGRRHRDRAATLIELAEILREARGNVLIPAFAVGRSQELLYQLGKHFDDWNIGRWRVFLDSPLAIRTTGIYWDYPHLYDEEATILRKTVNPMPSLPNLELSQTAEESMAINDIDRGAIVIAGSGMCNGGRILHHLKRDLGKRETRVLFTGYQPPGTLGRRIIDGADEVRIHGDEIKVAARCHTLGGMSAHGDADDLLRWYRRVPDRPPVYLVHGDPEAGRALRSKLANEGGAKAYLATSGQRLDLNRLRV